MIGLKGKRFCRFSSVSNLPKPKQLPDDSSNLSVSAFSATGLVVGNENGCFITSSTSASVDEVGYLRNKEVQCVLSGRDDSFYAACGESIYLFDRRTPLEKYSVMFEENEDEINQMKLSGNGQYLAACDDAGEVKIIDLKTNRLFKTLRRRHTNICSTIVFTPNKQNELISGGLDSQLIRWDYSRLRPVQYLNTQNVLKQMGDDSVNMFNPPFVHSVDISSDANFVAAGLGNGTLQVFQLMKSSVGLAPAFLVNKHSTLGIPCVHYMKSESFLSDINTQILLTGGNDGFVNFWNIPMDVVKSNKRQLTSNRVLTTDEINDCLYHSYDNHSKISSIDSIENVVVFTDQSATVKLVSMVV